MAGKQGKNSSRDVRGGKGAARSAQGGKGTAHGAQSGGKARGDRSRGPQSGGKARGAVARGPQGGNSRSKGTPRGKQVGGKDTARNDAAGSGKGGAYRKNSRTGEDVIAGKHAVIEALEAGVPLKKICVAQGMHADEAVEKIRELAEDSGIGVEFAPRIRIEERAPGLNHQGVMAVARPYEYASLHEILSEASHLDAALVIVLDHITDVGNFGAIARTAEVLGASGIVIPAKRSVDVVTSAYKTSAGAVSRLNIAKVSNIANACDALRDAGFWIAGASEKSQQDCWNSPMDGKLALVMGNEGAGISRLVQQKCDFMAKLPQRGAIGSLNVSCAAAALGYEWLRQSAAKGLFDSLEDAE